MNLRQFVEGQYGTKVVELLDQYAEIGIQASIDYDIGRRDRRALFDGQQLAIKAQLIELKGPIVTQRIHVGSTEAHDRLYTMIDSCHDVDDSLKEFRHNRGVQLDSESSEVFVFSTPEMAPKVIASLEAKYPGLGWRAIPQPLDLSSLTVCNGWGCCKEWLKIKYAEQDES